MLTLVVVGFARTFYARPFFGAIDEPTRSAELPRHLMLHGLVMTSWFALVVTQTLLIAKRNVALHRRLGIAGAALAVLVVVVDMRHRQSCVTTDTQYPVSSIGASARAVESGVCVARLCAPAVAVARRLTRSAAKMDFISGH